MIMEICRNFDHMFKEHLDGVYVSCSASIIVIVVIFISLRFGVQAFDL